MSDLDLYRQFRSAWRSLSRQQRRVLELRCQGLTIDESAQHLQISPQTVKGYTTGALAALRDILPETLVRGHGTVEQICWRIGYETALQDIEHTIATRKQAA